MKFVIIGLGGRGKIYADLIKKEGCEIVAVCDIAAHARDFAHNVLQIPKADIYSDSETFFKQGKLADALVIASMDKSHYSETMTALALGYDILLEKPMSVTEKECREIAALAEKLNRKVFICHVLRYAPLYAKVKEIIDSGSIGTVMTLSQTENVGYFHYAHSFVRGNWSNSASSSPMILQKCCHDLDIIR